MEDVSAPAREKLPQNRPALSVSQGRINNELTARKADFPFRDEHIFCRKIGHDLLIAAAMDKKGKPRLNDDIKSKSPAFGYYISKLFGSECSVAMGAIQHRLLGKKGADIHGDYGFWTGSFLNMERRITIRTILDFRIKLQHRLFREQYIRSDSGIQLADKAFEQFQRPESGIFFKSP